MSANVEAMVREGINAFKAGRKDEARALLLKATELDQYNEQAWLWLSGLMDSQEDQRTCLENVLAINPNNERASQGLAYLTGGSQPSGSPAAFSATPPSSEISTSVEWGAPPESSPAAPVWAQTQPPRRGEPTAQALDDWVTNLNLSAAESAFTFTSGSGTSASPFSDFDMGDDPFAEGPFSAAPAAIPAVPADDPFAAPPPRRAPSSPPTPAAAPRSEPPARRRRSGASPARSENASLLYGLETEREEAEQAEEGMFGFIPAEIAPTRLPGTHERVPALLMVGTVILVLLNLGAAILLMLGLLT